MENSGISVELRFRKVPGLVNSHGKWKYTQHTLQEVCWVLVDAFEDSLARDRLAKPHERATPGEIKVTYFIILIFTIPILFSLFFVNPNFYLFL